MTYLLDDNGNEIVLNTEVSVTKQVLSFFNFKIRGNFSTNFRIPNTSATRAALGYYGVNQSEKVAFSTQAWGLYKNGNLLGRGFLVIQGQNRTELDCFFAYGNASWINLLAGNLKELNWSAYDQDFTRTNLDTLKSASTGMVFPFVDWGWNWKKTDYMYPWVNTIYGIDSAQDSESFLYDLYPAFYMKTIVREVAKQKEFKITGNIFDDPVFDKMIIPLPEIDRTLTDENYLTDNDTYAGAQYIAAGATQTITFAYTNNTDSLVSTSTGRLQNDGRSRNFRIRLAFQFDSAFNGSVLLRKNGSTIYTYNFTVASFLRYQTLSLAAGDYLDVQITNSSGFTRSVTDKYFGYQLCGSWYKPELKILAVDVIPNTAIIEVIKYITQAFNCIVDFNDFTRTITINKIDSVRKENATDLTDTVVDYDIEWQNGFAKTNYIRNNQFQDLEPFNKQELGFGEFDFDGPDNGKKQDDTFELKFGPSLVRTTENKINYSNLAKVPLFTLNDDGDVITYSGASSASAGAFTTLTGLSVQIPLYSIVRITDTNGYYDGYSYVFSSTATTIGVYGRFIGTSSGTLRVQKINYQQAGFRVLLNYPSYTVSNHSWRSFIRLIDLASSTDVTTYPVAFYYIPDTQYTFSSELKLGAHPGAIDNAVSIPLSTQYYNRLQKIARNPVINVRLRISETLFNTINLSEFVYIDIGEWSGYFFVQKIDNYKDSSTDVKVQLLKVD